MKTSLHILLAALAATVVLAGCVQEITPPSFEKDKVNPAAEGSRVIAVSFAPQTKTYLDKDGFQPKFNDEDSILISNGEALDTCAVDVNGDKATISTDLTGPLTAVYPYTAAKMNESNLNQIDTVLVSTVQSGKFADANICMAKMTSENDESLSFENKTAVFCIYPPAGKDAQHVEVSAEGFVIANNIPTGSAITDSSTIHVNTTTADSVYVSILVPEGLTVGSLSFSDGTNVKSVTTGAPADKEIAAGTLYTVTNENWKSPEADIPEPLEGVFTVGNGADGIAGTDDDIKVRFSQGNLRYVVGTDDWGFYEHQYDSCNTTTYNGHHSDTISLFTWGYDATKSVAPNGTDYVEGHTTDGDKQLYPSEDWGFVFEGESSIWRTLTRDEWCYLFAYNPEGNNFITTSPRYPLFKTGVTVCGSENCVVLLPDNWDGTVISLLNFAAQNTYDESSNPKWSEMEAAGAVCLPAAGYRNGSNVSNVGNRGYYWSSTASDSSRAYGVGFYSFDVYPGNFGYRYDGYSVRLVTDVPSAPTPTAPEGFVDLGVKDVDGNPVYWAERNLGASNAWDYGKYFSWGDVTGQTPTSNTFSKAFSWDNDVFGQTFNNGISQSEACPSGVLAQAYDAAYQTDNAWRMPTEEDFTELAKQCFLEWTDNYNGTGVKGLIVWKAKDGDAGWFKNSVGDGRQIKDNGSEYKDPETHPFSNTYAIGTDPYVFFPAAGYGDSTKLDSEEGDIGGYWSSSLRADYLDRAYFLSIESSNVFTQSDYDRYLGFPVRPVSE